MITVGIIEDKYQYLHDIESLLQETTDLAVIGLWQDAETAIKDIPELLPDVVLVDIQLPGINGIECIAYLKKACPVIQFMVLTVYEDDTKIFEALKSGATGYLIKGDPQAVIVSGIREIHGGGSPMSSGIARRVIGYFQNPLATKEYLLSSREVEVLTLLSGGKLYKEISDELKISLSTVKKHLKNIYSKLHVQNKVEAVVKWRAK